MAKESPSPKHFKWNKPSTQFINTQPEVWHLNKFPSDASPNTTVHTQVTTSSSPMAVVCSCVHNWPYQYLRFSVLHQAKGDFPFPDRCLPKRLSRPQRYQWWGQLEQARLARPTGQIIRQLAVWLSENYRVIPWPKFENSTSKIKTARMMCHSLTSNKRSLPSPSPASGGRWLFVERIAL